MEAAPFVVCFLQMVAETGDDGRQACDAGEEAYEKG